MEKIEYLRKLHDLAYVANMADSDRAEPWQQWQHAATHAQPLLDMVKSLMSPAEYELFCDCFGDFDAFTHNLERLD